MAKDTRRHVRCIHISLAAIPEFCEDSYAFRMDDTGGYLCVADGCGGLGAKRYERAKEHTGAYLAARVVTRFISDWARKIAIPKSMGEGRAVSSEISKALRNEMKKSEATYGSKRAVRIVGSMQCALPTTLCAALVEVLPQNALDCLLLWAGDSRGYLLNAGGLHQLTADHTRGNADAMEGLYRDASLNNMINADTSFVISARRLRVKSPCLVITATDGAFAYLPTPMEFEWLLVSTLQDAANMKKWQDSLSGKLKEFASDDCTILIAMIGYESFEKLKEALKPRYERLWHEYIAPVREKKQNLDCAREKWEEYRKDYDWTEGAAQGELDWRI